MVEAPTRAQNALANHEAISASLANLYWMMRSLRYSEEAIEHIEVARAEAERRVENARAIVEEGRA